MQKLLYVSWVLIFYLSTSGQCPLRDTLWNRINFLAVNATPVEIQLEELLVYKTKLSGCPNSKDSTDAFLFQRIGVMYFKKADYQASIRYTLDALKLLQDIEKKMYVNPRQKFLCYWNLKIYYDSLDLISKKNEALDSCISIGLNGNITSILILYAFRTKIINLQNVGEYSRSVQYASLCQNLAEKLGYANDEVMGQIFNLKVDALLLMENYKAVKKELTDKNETQKHFPIDQNFGALYQLWASYFIKIGKIDSALISYKKSFQIYSKCKSKEGCASSLNGLGFIYSDSLKEYSKALNYYFKALTYFDANESISTFTNIGNVYVRKQLFDSAFYFYQKAFDQIYPGINESSLLEKRKYELVKNLADYVVTLVLDKADAHMSQYKLSLNEKQLRQTIDFYRKADQVMDKIKEEQFETLSKLSWRKNIRRLYEHAIEACWKGRNLKDGLFFFEKSRAVLLDDQLKEDRLMQNQEALNLFQVRTRINHLENELDTADPHSEHFANAQTELYAKKEEQDKLLAAIKVKDPLYFARNYNADVIDIRDVINIILKDHTAIIEIFNGDSSLFTLTITRDSSWISRINKSSYDNLSKQFMFFISSPRLLNGQFPSFIDVSRKLYDLIFKDKPLPSGRIIVSPDGMCFPFEALVVDRGPKIHYMLEDYCISYTYSARFLLNHFYSPVGRRAEDFMGMAPVEYASYMKLAPLPGSDISLNQIQTHFSSPFTLRNETASKNNFLTNFANYKIVQIYSHASYSSSIDKPLIYFADSSMDLSELFSKERPVARLVVLSACQTALGTEYKGEGVFSFSRGFAGLGIPATVSNLWSVDNEATYRITELFYRFVAQGLPTDLALQKAKLTFIKNETRQKGLPFYWAAPILTGQAEIIHTKNSFPYGEFILITGITGVLFWTLIKRNKPKKTSLAL